VHLNRILRFIFVKIRRFGQRKLNEAIMFALIFNQARHSGDCATAVKISSSHCATVAKTSTSHWHCDTAATKILASHPTSFPGLQCEDEARHEEALVWAGHVTTKYGSI
jgi:hypothetical protein